MTSKGTLSVIIPVHDRFGLLVDTVKSVLNQTYTNIEVIIIDDGSSRPARLILNKFFKSNLHKKIIVIRQKNSGPAVARNTGLAVANGEYVLFLDSDDLLEPTFAETMISSLVRCHVKVITCFLKPKFKTVSRSNKFFYGILSATRSLCFSLMLFLNNGELHPTFFYMTRLSGMVFHNSVLRTVRFNPEYKSAEDWQFINKIINRSHPKIVIIPKTLVSFLYHKDSETLGRSDYFKYYRLLIKEVPPRVKHSFGVRLFNLYLKLSEFRNKNE